LDIKGLAILKKGAEPRKKILEIAGSINTHGNVVAALPRGSTTGAGEYMGLKLWLLSRSATKLVDGR